jgi:hypothetical protein
LEQQDLERIARATLKELGVSAPSVTVAPIENQPGQWRIDIPGNRTGPSMMKIKCGKGTTPQWVREQIFNQYTT